ncbi:MAG: GNAT family N-acetyltransferase [Defluviitaleaceae bacterium]|nr:GNAT family N-acetyltransferase [Defluviitaleaceae bacterium]
MKEILLPNGEKVIISPPTISDAKELLEYINLISGESEFLTVGAGDFSMTLEEQERFIENSTKQENNLLLVAKVDGKIIGNLKFSASKRPRIAHQGEFGITVAKAYWSFGLASALLSYLIEWAYKTGIIKKINLKVRSDNQRAIHLYKKFGFKEEGLITRDYLIKNKFYDSIAMGLTID